MVDVDVFKNLTAVKKVEQRDGIVHLHTSIEELQGLLFYLKEHHGLIYLLDIFAIPNQENGFELIYLAKNLESEMLMALQCSVRSKDSMPSCGMVWGSAFHRESEVKQYWDVPFEFQLNSNLMSKQGQYRPVRRHPLLMREINWDFQLEDNLVSYCQIHYGNFHLGQEKSLQQLPLEQVLFQVGKLNSRRIHSIETLWCDVIEKSSGVSLTDRARALRMIFLELERIQDHFQSFEVLAYELRYPQMRNLFGKLTSKTREIFNYYSHSKVHKTLNCVGGIRTDIPRGWQSHCSLVLEQMQRAMMDFFGTIEGNSLWKERLRCGAISSGEALEAGLAGPNLRASGVNYDWRKNSPYYFYSDIEFEVPVGQHGQVLDRFLVRKQEVLQSMRIIHQVLDNIPTGAIVSGEGNYFRMADPSASDFDGEHFAQSVQSKLYTRDSQALSMMEGPQGHCGIFIQTQDSKLQRVRLISADKNSLETYPAIVKGNDYDDCSLIYESLNIHINEVEK